MAKPEEAKSARKKGEPRVFISSCTDDFDTASQVAKCLERVGISTWWSQANATPGENVLHELRAALSDSTLCVLIVSRSAMESDWLKSAEWPEIIKNSWDKSGFTLCPVLLEDVVRPAFLKHVTAIECNDREHDVNRAADAIRALLSGKRDQSRHFIHKYGDCVQFPDKRSAEREARARFHDLVWILQSHKEQVGARTGQPKKTDTKAGEEEGSSDEPVGGEA